MISINSGLNIIMMYLVEMWVIMMKMRTTMTKLTVTF